MPKHSLDSFPTDNDTLSEASWQTLLKQVNESLDTAAALAQDEGGLAQRFGPEKTVAEELTVIASHNTYHFGRMVALRQILGIWSADLGDSW